MLFRSPRCASGRVAARRGDGDVLGSGTARGLDAADDAPRRNPQGRASFVACLCRSGLAHPAFAAAAAATAEQAWSPMRVALASWPATRSAPSRPRGVLLGALRAFAKRRKPWPIPPVRISRRATAKACLRLTLPRPSTHALPTGPPLRSARHQSVGYPAAGRRTIGDIPTPCFAIPYSPRDATKRPPVDFADDATHNGRCQAVRPEAAQWCSS